MALVRRSPGFALAASLIAGIVGCSTSKSGSQLARDENRKMDTFTRCGAELDTIAPGLRSRVTDELDWLDVHWPRHLPHAVVHADLFPDARTPLGL